MAFVLVLSYSRYPFLRFYLNASLANLIAMNAMPISPAAAVAGP